MATMVITHHGGQCFKVTFGDLTLVFDPVAKGAKFPAIRFGADIALVSGNKPEYNGLEEATYGEKAPFPIVGPGEYERGGIAVQGFLTKGDGHLNTVYAVALEDMTIVHLGNIADKELLKEAREGIGAIDVLFVPVGGALSPAEAHELAVSLEPRVIVPMHWSESQKALDAFLKEEGGAPERTDKLTLKKKDALARDGSIIVVTP